SLSQEEKTLLSQFDPQLNELWDRPEKERDSEKTLSDLAHYLELAHGVATDGRPEGFHLMGFDMSGLAIKWTGLADVCHRLEVLAHKQLRQIPFSDKENGFIAGYGKQLARVMLYGGNSYFDPRDDAPRIVDVFSNPVVGKHLLVGTARPRTLWVVYLF